MPNSLARARSGLCTSATMGTVHRSYFVFIYFELNDTYNVMVNDAVRFHDRINVGSVYRRTVTVNGKSNDCITLNGDWGIIIVAYCLQSCSRRWTVGARVGGCTCVHLLLIIFGRCELNWLFIIFTSEPYFCTRWVEVEVNDSFGQYGSDAYAR